MVYNISKEYFWGIKLRYTVHTVNGIDIAEIKETKLDIYNAQKFLDVLSIIPCTSLILKKKYFNKDFFDLKSGMIQDMIQKLTVNSYRLVIVGDFKDEDELALVNFVNSSSIKPCIFFTDTLDEGLKKLSQ